MYVQPLTDQLDYSHTQYHGTSRSALIDWVLSSINTQIDSVNSLIFLDLMASVTFTPRVAIVTGAARGIGRSIALKLADEGLDVGVNDVLSNAEKVTDVVEEIKRRGRQAIPVVGDVSNEELVKDMIKEVVEKLGRLDVVRR